MKVLKITMRNIFLSLVVLLINGCGVLDVPLKVYKSAKNYAFPPGERLYWKSVDIIIRKNANRNYPIAIDITLIKDEALFNKILELDSSKWFDQKDILLKTFAEEIVIESWELAPEDGLKVPEKFFKEERVFGALVFGKYFNDGDYKARIDNLEGMVVIDFDVDELNVYTLKRN